MLSPDPRPASLPPPDGWIPAAQTPPLVSDGFTRASVPHYGFFKDGAQHVVVCSQWDDEPPRWRTTCSEGWDITDTLTHYHAMLPGPVIAGSPRTTPGQDPTQA